MVWIWVLIAMTGTGVVLLWAASEGVFARLWSMDREGAALVCAYCMSHIFPDVIRQSYFHQHLTYYFGEPVCSEVCRMRLARERVKSWTVPVEPEAERQR
jgi:hypothetical protein